MAKICFIVMGLFLGGCACWTNQQKMNTPACVVAHDVVDCTTNDVAGELPYFASIIGKLLSGGMNPNNIPWSDIVAQAEGMGIKDGGCLLAQLKSLLFGSPGGSQEFMATRKTLGDILEQYKMKHFGSTKVQFKIKDKDGKVVIL